MVAFAYSLKVYVESYKSQRKEEEIVNVLEGIRIRAYSKKGIEWTIKGKYMKVVDKDVELLEVLLTSQEGTLKAGRAYIDRSSGKGELSQGVEVMLKDLIAKSQKVYMDIKEDRFYGDGRIELIEGGKRVEGKGFEIRLKPLKVIVYNARSTMD